MEEYVTVDELSARIKFSRQTLYNLIHRKTFVLGKHYLKPSAKKILFKWSEVEAWMEAGPSSSDEDSIHSDLPLPPYGGLQDANSFAEPRSRINI